MANPQAKRPSLDALRATALDAALAAGDVLLRHSERKLVIREKKGAGLVTNADVAAERAALKVLRRDFPQFKVLTEESAPDPAASRGPARWIMDPLDGTTNYVHRYPMYCVSIAAEWEGSIVAAVTHHPVLRETYVALRGRGAYLLRPGRAPSRLHISKTRRISDALLTTGFTYGKVEWLRTEMRAFEHLSARARATRRPGSAALDLAYTARGVFDGFWERRLSPWDVAAGSLLVEEAGGRVTDFAGRPFQVEAREILAAGPGLHPALLKVVGPR